MKLDFPLVHTGARLAAGQPLTIVALGSSSTAGAGASSPSASYPARLEAELRSRFPNAEIKVINRGVNGEDAQQMLARLDEAVLAEKPDLVLWQVGTNAVLRDHSCAGEAPLLREGIRRMKEAGADLVVIDSQYAPKVLAKSGLHSMLDLLHSTAKYERISIFNRFEIMHKWREVDGIPFEAVLSADGLHMNDWSYACIAKLLAAAIADAARGVNVAGKPNVSN
jgi:lysophospholipase L1-like esterase